jgi:hypothetical protein
MYQKLVQKIKDQRTEIQMLKGVIQDERAKVKDLTLASQGIIDKASSPDQSHAREYEKGVREFATRRQKADQSEKLHITLENRRAYDKSSIYKTVHDHAGLLVHFGDIIERILAGQESMIPQALSTKIDFVDGFQLAFEDDKDPRELQRLLRDYGLDVKMPIRGKMSGRYWLQLSSGPFAI